MALIGHGTKVPRRITVATRLDRQIRADVPVPDPRQKASIWNFIDEMRSGESFLAYGEKERVNASGYGRAKGYKMITRIDQELSDPKELHDTGSKARIYRIWKT